MRVSDRRPGDATDDALLERIALRDHDAVAALYDRHSRLLFGVILRILRDRGEAEDVLQEVYWSVWSKAASYRAALGAPAAWLVRLARNRAIDRIRTKAVRERTAEAADHPPQTASPEQSAVDNQQRAGIIRALQSLPEEQRVLIEQAYYTGLTQSELAAHFGLPLGTVKTRIRSGMTALRKQLATNE